MKIKFSKEIPEIYYRLKEVFGVEFKDIIIAYDNTIYCADELPEHCIAHEKVHLAQQENIGAWQWWDKYIKDKYFRIDQEVPAYKAQVKAIREDKTITHNHKKQWIEKLAKDLSGPMYGNIIGYHKALDLIK